MVTQLTATKTVPSLFDFCIWGGGTVYLLTPQSDKANDWVETNLPDQERQTLGDGIAVEPRYIEDISCGILNSGLCIEMNGRTMIIDGDGECALV